MGILRDVLNARYNDPEKPADEQLTAVEGIRQDSGLDYKQVGARDLADLDKYIDRRITAREDILTGALSTAAGVYVWPFSLTHLALAYPMQDYDTRQNTHRIQQQTAAECVYAGVLGDLFNRAAPRDEKYAAQRNFYIGDPANPADTGEAGRLFRDVRDSVRAAIQPNADPTQTGRLGTIQYVSGNRAKPNEWQPRRPEDEWGLSGYN